MKTIFWNVDTQYDFMKQKGKLYVKDAEKIEGNLSRLTELAKVNNIKVVNTADWHNETSEEISVRPDFITRFPEHCMQHTLGAEFIFATNPENAYKIDWSDKEIDSDEIRNKRNIVLYKDKFNVFKGTPHATKVIEILRPQRAIVYGVATNVCVNDAVVGLLERKVQVYIPSDAIKELPNLPLPCETWVRKGAIMTTTNEIYKMLEEGK